MQKKVQTSIRLKDNQSRIKVINALYTIRGLITIIYKQCLQINNKMTNDLVENRQKNIIETKHVCISCRRLI